MSTQIFTPFFLRIRVAAGRKPSWQRHVCVKRLWHGLGSGIRRNTYKLMRRNGFHSTQFKRICHSVVLSKFLLNYMLPKPRKMLCRTRRDEREIIISYEIIFSALHCRLWRRLFPIHNIVCAADINAKLMARHTEQKGRSDDGNCNSFLLAAIKTSSTAQRMDDGMCVGFVSSRLMCK